jgi:tellurite resistance protein TerC
MSAPPFPLWAWLVFVGLVLALLFLDLFVIHRNAREAPFKKAMWLSGFWIAISLAFGDSSGIWLTWVGTKRTSPPTC